MTWLRRMLERIVGHHATRGPDPDLARAKAEAADLARRVDAVEARFREAAQRSGRRLRGLR